jgi:hypothetical protein
MFEWRRTAPDAMTAEPVAPSLGIDEAQAVLHGRRRGILVAANGGLANQDALANSLAAIQAAIDHGLPMAVVDVCQTPDGMSVLDLDHALSHGTGPRAQWRDLDYESLRVRTSQAPNGPAAAVTEALELARGRIVLGLRLRNAELPAIVAVIDKMNLSDEVLVFVTTAQQAQAARPYLQRQRPIMIGFDAPTPERLSRIESTPPWPTIVQLGPQALSSANVARVLAMGARVMVHQRGVLLVQIGSELRPYHKLGVTVVLTDWPRQLIREMQQINQEVGAVVTERPASTRPSESN